LRDIKQPLPSASPLRATRPVLAASDFGGARSGRPTILRQGRTLLFRRNVLSIPENMYKA
jgi:hypothetical protein